MVRIIASLATTLCIGFAWAQHTDSSATMQEHDKATEMCRSMKVKGDCSKMAMACHDKKDQAEMKACLTEQSKMKK